MNTPTPLMYSTSSTGVFLFIKIHLIFFSPINKRNGQAYRPTLSIRALHPSTYLLHSYYAMYATKNQLFSLINTEYNRINYSKAVPSFYHFPRPECEIESYQKVDLQVVFPFLLLLF